MELKKGVLSEHDDMVMDGAINVSEDKVTFLALVYENYQQNKICVL